MKWPSFIDASLRTKLTVLSVGNLVLVLTVVSAVFVANDMRSARRDLTTHLATVAAVIGDNAAAALSFEDRTGANELLSALGRESIIETATIYDRSGRRFAEFLSDPSVDRLAANHGDLDDNQQSPRTVMVATPIRQGSEKLGTIALRATTIPLEQRLARQLVIAAAAFTGCLFVALLLIGYLQGTISEPIAELADATRRIADRTDFSVRVTKKSNDELGVLADGFNLMLEQVEHREAVIVRSEQRYRSLANATSQVIFTTDAEGRFFGPQASWEHYTGQNEHESEGFGWLEAVHPKERAGLGEAWQRSIATGRKFQIEGQLRHARSRAYRWFVARAVPIRDDGGDVVEWVATVTDTDAEHRAEDALRRTADELAQSNTELEQFAHVVSHDLKAPLRAISSLAQWIHSDHHDVLGEEGRENLDLLVGRAHRLQDLIEGILRYSRAGRQKSTLARVDSREIARSAVEAIAPPASIRVIIDESLPHVTYDATQLRQVFQNLVDNGVKHLGRPSGEISITCHDRPDADEFSVRDNGVGIDAQHFDRIFTMFQTLKPRDEFESTGIGLALVKRIVERYGGTISVQSEPDQGATFRFTVPKSLKAAPVKA
jgi:PAS domain S-box-containing protein